MARWRPRRPAFRTAVHAVVSSSLLAQPTYFLCPFFLSLRLPRAPSAVGKSVFQGTCRSAGEGLRWEGPASRPRPPSVVRRSGPSMTKKQRATNSKTASGMAYCLVESPLFFSTRCHFSPRTTKGINSGSVIPPTRRGKSSRSTGGALRVMTHALWAPGTTWGISLAAYSIYSAMDTCDKLRERTALCAASIQGSWGTSDADVFSRLRLQDRHMTSSQKRFARKAGR